MLLLSGEECIYTLRVANINMEKWVIYLAIFAFVFYLGNTGSWSNLRGYATFTDDSVDVVQSGLVDDGTSVSPSEVFDDGSTDYSDGSYPQSLQQPMQIQPSQITLSNRPGPQLFYPTTNPRSVSFELAAPQEPSGHWPPGIEWGKEYFVFVMDQTASNTYSVFGLGDAFSNRWSGLRVIPQIRPSYGFAAFGNRIIHEYLLYPGEVVFGQEAGVDGFVGTGDDRTASIFNSQTSIAFTSVALARNAALYAGLISSLPNLVYQSFGNDFLAGTADDSTEVITTSFAVSAYRSPFGTSNSKISHYRSPDGLTIVLAGPGLNGVFEGGLGDDESLLFGGGGGVYPVSADLAYDASHFLFAIHFGAAPPYTQVLNLYDLRPIGGPRGRLRSFPALVDLFAGRQVPQPPPNAVAGPYYTGYALDGAFTTTTGTVIAGIYTVAAFFALADGSGATVLEVRDTGPDGIFFSGNDDLVRLYTVRSPDTIGAVDIKGRVLVFSGAIGGQSGLFVYPIR